MDGLSMGGVTVHERSGSVSGVQYNAVVTHCVLLWNDRSLMWTSVRTSRHPTRDIMSILHRAVDFRFLQVVMHTHALLFCMLWLVKHLQMTTRQCVPPGEQVT